MSIWANRVNEFSTIQRLFMRFERYVQHFFLYAIESSKCEWTKRSKCNKNTNFIFTNIQLKWMHNIFIKLMYLMVHRFDVCFIGYMAISHYMVDWNSSVLFGCLVCLSVLGIGKHIKSMQFHILILIDKQRCIQIEQRLCFELAPKYIYIYKKKKTFFEWL